MLRRPERALARLKGRLAQEQRGIVQQRVQMLRLRQALGEKGAERDRVLSLYRKGRISEGAVVRVRPGNPPRGTIVILFRSGRYNNLALETP
jgi:hypothetical protein